jgi:hypothetical protein
MIYIKWLILAVLDLVLLLTVPIAAPLIALFTREQSYGQAPYTWGWLWGTYDNPPQGDEGYVRKRAPFLAQTRGWKGYLNRVWWMIRNPLYGFARIASVEYSKFNTQVVIGKEDISDKYKRPGWYFVRLYSQSSKLVGFEFYGVFPWSATRNLRMRLGWKILTDKFERNGFAQLVNTFNPVDGYGDA